VLTVWADNCSEQFKSRYQLGWSVLYINKTTLEVIHLFFFCPQHGRVPLMDLVGTVKLQSKLKKNSQGICQLQLMYICGFSKISLLFILPALAFLRSEKESSDLYPTALFPGITSLSRLNLLEFQHFMRFVSRKVPLLEKYDTDSAHVIASAVLLDVFINA